MTVCVPADVSMSLLWSQAEQGTTKGQDWLLGPKGILGHLQSIWPVRRQLVEAGGRVFPPFLQLSKSVLQLTEHVKPKHANKDFGFIARGHQESTTKEKSDIKNWWQTWQCTRILSGMFRTRSWQQTEGQPVPSSQASASHRMSHHPAF